MTQIATFALGCFWGPDESFSRLPGVVRTTVGYSGGSTPSPTYTNLGDHTETVEVEFDPEKISYRDLLKHFFEEHDPTYRARTEYQSIIFTHGPQQEKDAMATRDETQKLLRHPIVTEIRPAETFYRAEEYHQKYLRKSSGARC